MNYSKEELRKSFISQLEFFTDKFRQISTFSQYMDCLIDSDDCLESMINRLSEEDLKTVGPKIRELTYESVVAAMAIEYPKDNGATLEGVQMKLYNFLDLANEKIRLDERITKIYGNLQQLAINSRTQKIFTYKFWDKIKITPNSKKIVEANFLTNRMSHN